MYQNVKSFSISILFLLCILIYSCIIFPSHYTIDLCYNMLDENSNWQIYADNKELTKQYNISNNQYDDAYSPSWSPDGKYIAFRNDFGLGVSGSSINLYDVLSDSLINITPEFTSGESGRPLLWSPAGDKIIYYYHKVGEPYFYYIMNFDGSNKIKLFEKQKDENIISFCDQGTALLYSKEQSLYKINIDNLTSELIVDFSTLSNYSTYVDDYNDDNSTILCHDDSSRWNGGATFIIKEINLESLNIDTLIQSSENNLLFFPSYSNDYTRISFFEKNHDSNIQKLLIIDGEDNIHEIYSFQSETMNFGHNKPLFSPYNKYILFELITNKSNSSGTHMSTTNTIIINIITKNTVEIMNAQNARWNPQKKF